MSLSQQLPQVNSNDTLLEKVILQNDLVGLSSLEKVQHVKNVCESLGLNPLTKPIQLLKLQGKEVMYMAKDGTEQIRNIHNVSIVKLETEFLKNDLYVVKAYAAKPNGRQDCSTSAISISGLKGNDVGNAMKKCECVPLEYEILTKDGFKSPIDLIAGEQVLSMNPLTHILEWGSLEDFSIYENQEVIKIGNRKFDCEITESHKWAVESQNGERGLKPFNELTTSHNLVLSGNFQSTDSILNTKESATLGWILTDGSIKKYKGKFYRATIYQSKKENFDSIDWAVSCFEDKVTKGVSIRKEGNWLDQHNWYLSKKQTENLFNKCGFTSFSELPRIVCSLNKESALSMLNAMMKADGDKREIFGKGKMYIVEVIQILCALTGHVTSKVKKRIFKNSSLPFYLINKFSTKNAHMRCIEIISKRKTTVWCPTTKDGTWVCRTNNGQVFVTGNTQAKRRVTLSICGLGMLDESEIEDIPKNNFIKQVTHELPQNHSVSVFTTNDQIKEINNVLIEELVKSIEATKNIDELRKVFAISTSDQIIRSDKILIGKLIAAKDKRKSELDKLSNDEFLKEYDSHDPKTGEIVEKEVTNETSV